MAQLVWDKVGDRKYETGISRAVFYKSDRFGVVWNGVTSVQESTPSSVEPIYFDGVKFNDIVTVGDTEAVIRAFTYPDEFLEYEGSVEDTPGFLVLNQEPKRFGLCYRTEIGNDFDGLAHYKIHVLFNLTAIPSDTEFQTINQELSPIEFEWDLTAIPEQLGNFRPTAHIVIDSHKIDPYLLRDIEAVLYGSDDEEGGNFVVSDNGDDTWTAVATDSGIITINPNGTFSITSVYASYLDPPANTTYELTSAPNRDALLPSLRGLASFISNWGRFVVTDNGDGTWTAASPIEGVIEMVGDDQFEITTDTAAYVDPPANTKFTIASAEKNEEDLLL